MNLAIIPMFFIFIFNVVILVFAIWFAVSHVKTQKERNLVLKEISKKLDHLMIDKKEE